MKRIDSGDIKQVLSKNIKSARQQLNYTHENLSEEIGVSSGFLKDLESPTSNSLGSLVTFVNLCKSLNLTPNQLLKDIFVEENTNISNAFNQFSFLSLHEQNAICTLIQYFTNNDKFDG